MFRLGCFYSEVANNGQRQTILIHVISCKVVQFIGFNSSKLTRFIKAKYLYLLLISLKPLELFRILAGSRLYIGVLN